MFSLETLSTFATTPLRASTYPHYAFLEAFEAHLRPLSSPVSLFRKMDCCSELSE